MTDEIIYNYIETYMFYLHYKYLPNSMDDSSKLDCVRWIEGVLSKVGKGFGKLKSPPEKRFLETGAYAPWSPAEKPKKNFKIEKS